MFFWFSWFWQDERELKRQKRKQSNRESARRSRLRKQVQMYFCTLVGRHFVFYLPFLIRILCYRRMIRFKEQCAKTWTKKFICLNCSSVSYVFQAECEDLQARVETLSNENHSLREELHRLSEECEKLTSENANIKVCFCIRLHFVHSVLVCHPLPGSRRESLLIRVLAWIVKSNPSCAKSFISLLRSPVHLLMKYVFFAAIQEELTRVCGPDLVANLEQQPDGGEGNSWDRVLVSLCSNRDWLSSVSHDPSSDWAGEAMTLPRIERREIVFLTNLYAFNPFLCNGNVYLWTL